ncbi:AAA family ATPase [Bacillus sp. JJ722]|uniref:AAA family ATPase n=1 Tax=Bacillus sp. JJ722 TaxID=3122973 RepID=UPI0030004877
MTEIISFYSVAASQGKRTLSLALAELLAEQNHKVLYVELDYKMPAVAIATRISDSQRNSSEYFNRVVLNRNFDPTAFVLKKEHLLKTEEKDLWKSFNKLPKELDYLLFPLDYGEKSFPKILTNEETAEKDAHEFIEQLIYALKNTSYQAVILNLPTDLSNIFGYEMLAQSDHVIEVITPSSTQLFARKKTVKFLSTLSPQIEDKWLTVLNMISEEVDEMEYQKLFGEEEMIQIPFDPGRQKEELAIQLSSPFIKEKMETVALHLKFAITPTVPKRRFFTKGV